MCYNLVEWLKEKLPVYYAQKRIAATQVLLDSLLNGCYGFSCGCVGWMSFKQCYELDEMAVGDFLAN